MLVEIPHDRVFETWGPNYQVVSQFDQIEYVSQTYDAYGGIPPPSALLYLVGSLQQFAGGSIPPKSEALVPNPGLVEPSITENKVSQFAALFITQVQLAVENK